VVVLNVPGAGAITTGGGTALVVVDSDDDDVCASAAPVINASAAAAGRINCFIWDSSSHAVGKIARHTQGYVLQPFMVLLKLPLQLFH
jgi:hypothetical protein